MHTPGPWSIIERTDTIDGEPVLYVGQPDRREAMGDYQLGYAEHDVARVFSREDARLIAHAPAMLAALQRIDAALERLMNSNGWNAPWDNISGGVWAGPSVHEAQDTVRAMLRAVEG